MKATIALLPGDGIGPEVIVEARRVLDVVAARFGHAFAYRQGLIGGCAIDATGTALPPETLTLCQSSDAVLLGAVGGPQWSDPRAAVRPEQGLLQLRRHWASTPTCGRCACSMPWPTPVHCGRSASAAWICSSSAN